MAWGKPSRRGLRGFVTHHRVGAGYPPVGGAFNGEGGCVLVDSSGATKRLGQTRGGSSGQVGHVRDVEDRAFPGRGRRKGGRGARRRECGVKHGRESSPSSGMAVTPGTKALKDPGTHRGERPHLLWDPPVKGALSDIIWFLSTGHMQAGDMREPKTAPP